MNLRSTFRSIIAMHQEELPIELMGRALQLPVNSGNIVTVTGIRRCGKSSVLSLTMNRLLERGVQREKILYIGFDDERFLSMTSQDLDEALQAYREMYPEHSLKDVYMFFDEIQLIEGWELFVLRVYKNYCKNIFITGSTTKMLSEEMNSALRGWPDEYRAWTLSFDEYLSFRKIQVNRFTESGNALIANAFRSYCHEGGFPKVVLTQGMAEKTKILQSYFNTMLFRDMIEHYHINASPSVVRYFLKRVMDNLTKPTSVNKIFNELKSLGMKVSKDSLYHWLDYACNIFLFSRVPKYSTSLTKENMSLSKYYIADVGLRNAVLLSQSEDEGKALENIVYMMLEQTLAKTDKIYYFNESNECDFVVQRRGKVEELIQVCWELNDDNKEREVAGLLAAAKYTSCRKCRIITFNQEMLLNVEDLSVPVVSILSL